MNYTQITKEFTEEFFKLAENANNITITSHFSPDGDSISSTLSTYRILSDRYLNKNIRIVYSGKIDERFSYFQNFNKIIWADDMTDELKETDLLVIADCSLYSRFTKYPERLSLVKNQICIDHHASGTENFTLSTIIPELSSCSELIFRLFEQQIVLNKDSAETFLLGILTDTGSFAFLDSSQSETFITAKKLIDAGDININILKSKYTAISKREFSIVQEFVKNTSFSEVDGWPPFQYSYVNREFVENEDFTNNEITSASTAYIAGYLTSIKDYSWGFIIKPKASYCSVSTRSLPGSVNVRDMLERMELGGGHDRASGGIFKKETDSKDAKVCIEQIIEWMRNNKPLLT